MKALAKVRELAEKTAALTGEVQCIVRHGDGWQFIPESAVKNEEIIEYVI